MDPDNESMPATAAALIKMAVDALETAAEELRGGTPPKQVAHDLDATVRLLQWSERRSRLVRDQFRILRRRGDTRPTELLIQEITQRLDRVDPFCW